MLCLKQIQIQLRIHIQIQIQTQIQVFTCMKDLPGKQEHPLLCFHSDHEEEGCEEAGKRQHLTEEIV